MDAVLHSHSDAGEIPPPAPRACFGRDELVDKIIGLAENLTPIALIGAGGIGKTSIALAVLHHDRIKQRFRNNRRFIRCDQFTASPANLLRRLSEVIGAGVENPDNLTPLRPSLTSKEMLIVLDNAESILDPRGASGREINAVVRELSQFNNVCLCITSRITTVPSDCKTFEIPTLSMAAARDAFYRIYEYGGQSDSVNDILAQLDFHPLSITLLATVAHQNKWDNSRLVREWEQHLTAVLQTGYNESLAHTIELSLASPMFRELGPDARDLLEVVAFFPQGVDENNLDWLFPNISNRTAIFDTFCILSLAYRNNGFVTMLAPLRDHLHPKDPTSSPLLCATKDRYFTRLSAGYHYPNSQESEAQWIVTEDTNAEHLVYIFASFGAGADQVWEAYAAFIKHLRLHKPRHTILKQTIESLPDDHPSKPECLFELAELLRSVGNHVGQKKLLNHALALVRKQGDDPWVAKILTGLANANRMLGLHGEGIKQAREALEIFEQLNDTVGRARCLAYLSMLLQVDNQLDAAIEAASLAIILLPERGQEYLLSQSQRLLGNVYHFKGEREKAIHHFEAALEIASPLNFQDPLFWINHSLACLFLDGGEFDHAHAYIQQAKSHAVNNPLSLGYAMECRARIWFQQRRLEEAISEALRALDVYEKLGATEKSKVCGTLVQQIEKVITRAKNESK